MKHRQWIGLACVLALLCTGCSLDVESFLQPPKIGGQQQAVQTALETYVRDTAGAGVRFIPEYPMSGDYAAAFTLCDSQGFPVEGNQQPATAVVFYSLSTAPEETRVNLLRQDEEGWVSVADAVGTGTAIHQVAFGDLDGDGTAELITGWSGYNSRTFHLTVYGTAEGLTPLSRDLLYSSFFVGDVTASGYDDLLLLTAGNEVSASLYGVQEGALTLRDTLRLNTPVQQFGDMTLCRLAEGVHGLFVEGFPAGDTAVTQLLLYDGAKLKAPFDNQESTPYTTRNGHLAARDIDGDGVVEIPTHTVLEGHTADQVGGTVTGWWCWDYATGLWQERGYSLVNQSDGYLVMLDGDVRSQLDTAYNPDTRTLTLRNTATGSAYLWLVAGGPLSDPPVSGAKRLALLGTKEGREGLYAYYDPAVIGAEKIGYMVIPF